MGRIRRLDPHVVNQIAAGEVVDRPASVVKELVENALDAGARRVVVRLEDGGKGLIEVSDDGWGMDADDLALAFASHATSKVSSVSDLEHVASLGFRGEALASIGSVSRARVVSRARGAPVGALVEDREGELGPVTPAAAAPGTVVRVENLFGRVPARRKFLRTAATELGHVSDLLERLALAWCEVAFVLEHEGRRLLDLPAGDTRLARIERLHGPEVARALLAVKDDTGQPQVEGFVGPPSLTRGDERLKQVFLNGRHVRDKTVAHALREAYRDLVPPGGRHPIAFLFLTSDPSQVDVNVHPTKAEVRWRDSSAVHAAVRRSVRRVLEAARPGTPLSVAPTAPAALASVAETVDFAFTHAVGRPAVRHTAFPSAHAHEHAGCEMEHEPAGAPGGPAARAATVQAPEAPAAAPVLRPVGQALGTYLVLEGQDQLVLVDQHALHERVLFEQINARLNRQGNLEVQRLLVPHVVHLGGAATARLLEERELLRTLGWLVEPFGDGALAVSGHPVVLRRPDAEAVLGEVAEVLEKGTQRGLDRAALLSSAVDRLACRAAVMAGDRLQPDEVLALLEQSEALNHAHSCPHGRPTRLTLSKKDLERWFHRRL